VTAYRAALDVPRELVPFTAKLRLAERRRRGTPRASRALTCFWQAVLTLRPSQPLAAGQVAISICGGLLVPMMSVPDVGLYLNQRAISIPPGPYRQMASSILG
jgi:hypothetical protein